MQALQNIPFDSIFSGITWGALSNAHHILPLYSNDSGFKRNAALVGALFAAVAIPLSTATIPSLRLRLIVSVLTWRTFTLATRFHREYAHVSPEDYAGWQKVVLPAANLFKKQEQRIFLALNLITSATELAQGQIAYPVTNLAVLAGAYAGKKWVKETSYQGAIALVAFTALALIQPARGILDRICWVNGKMGAVGTRAKKFYAEHPRIFWALIIISVLNATKRSIGII